jgi:hypothetical protein
MVGGLAPALLLGGGIVARPFVSFAFTLSRSTAGFVPSKADPRVLFEPGADEEARRRAAALSGAIATVEGSIGGAFVRPVAVYVCATPASFERFAAGDRAAGTTLGGRLFLAPRLAVPRAPPGRGALPPGDDRHAVGAARTGIAWLLPRERRPPPVASTRAEGRPPDRTAACHCTLPAAFLFDASIPLRVRSQVLGGRLAPSAKRRRNP